MTAADQQECVFYKHAAPLQTLEFALVLQFNIRICVNSCNAITLLKTQQLYAKY